MNLATAFALVASSVHAATTITVFVMSRAPGWRRVRGFGFVALWATLYSMEDVWATMRPLPPSSLDWVLRLNLSFASLHVAAWTYYRAPLKMRFTFSQLQYFTTVQQPERFVCCIRPNADCHHAFCLSVRLRAIRRLRAPAVAVAIAVASRWLRSRSSELTICGCCKIDHRWNTELADFAEPHR